MGVQKTEQVIKFFFQMGFTCDMVKSMGLFVCNPSDWLSLARTCRTCHQELVGDWKFLWRTWKSLFDPLILIKLRHRRKWLRGIWRRALREQQSSFREIRYLITQGWTEEWNAWHSLICLSDVPSDFLTRAAQLLFLPLHPHSHSRVFLRIIHDTLPKCHDWRPVNILLAQSGIRHGFLQHLQNIHDNRNLKPLIMEILRCLFRHGRCDLLETLRENEPHILSQCCSDHHSHSHFLDVVFDAICLGQVEVMNWLSSHYGWPHSRLIFQQIRNQLSWSEEERPCSWKCFTSFLATDHTLLQDKADGDGMAFFLINFANRLLQKWRFSWTSANETSRLEKLNLLIVQFVADSLPSCRQTPPFAKSLGLLLWLLENLHLSRSQQGQSNALLRCLHTSSREICFYAKTHSTPSSRHQRDDMVFMTPWLEATFRLNSLYPSSFTQLRETWVYPGNSLLKDLIYWYSVTDQPQQLRSLLDRTLGFIALGSRDLKIFEKDNYFKRRVERLCMRHVSMARHWIHWCRQHGISRPFHFDRNSASVTQKQNPRVHAPSYSPNSIHCDSCSYFFYRSQNGRGLQRRLDSLRWMLAHGHATPCLWVMHRYPNDWYLLDRGLEEQIYFTFLLLSERTLPLVDHHDRKVFFEDLSLLFKNFNFAAGSEPLARLIQRIYHSFFDFSSFFSSLRTIMNPVGLITHSLTKVHSWCFLRGLLLDDLDVPRVFDLKEEDSELVVGLRLVVQQSTQRIDDHQVIRFIPFCELLACRLGVSSLSKIPLIKFILLDDNQNKQ